MQRRRYTIGYPQGWNRIRRQSAELIGKSILVTGDVLDFDFDS